MRHSIPSNLLPMIVNALVISHVRYCLAVFGNGSQKNMHRLQKIQNFALRVISGRRKFDHISDVRDDLEWLTVPQLYKQHCLTFIHKILRSGEPQALASHLQANSTLRSRNTRQDADLALPRVRTESGRRRLFYHMVRSYNDLPDEMKGMSVQCFRRAVDEFLKVRV